MKTVKAKLFLGFTILVFFILSAISVISIEIISYYKYSENVSLFDETVLSSSEIIEKGNDKQIPELDKYINLKEQFLIVLKDEELIFSNESNYKTKNILSEIHQEVNEQIKENDYKIKEKNYSIEEGYLFIHKYLEKNDSIYIIYIGIDDDVIEEEISIIALIIVFLNITIFIILLVLAYILISKTIKPLKLILEELNSLQSASDLSKRIKETKTDDEFEELIKSLNIMLGNIENSVENIKQFSSDVSHELRTPLTIIQGEIELAKNKEFSKEEIEILLEKIDFEQKKLQEIIKNLLLISRIEKEDLKNSKASLDKVIFEVIEQNLESLENKNLELKFDIEDDLEIRFGEKYLNMVVNNLVSNAIKYTDKGYISINAKKKENKIILEIKDSGIGILKEDQEKIFERFYRVDKVRTSAKEGLGLGLSIVKKICKGFGSSIFIRSKIKEGTTFIVEFKL